MTPNRSAPETALSTVRRCSLCSPLALCGALFAGAILAACGATRPPLEVVRPWEVATQAVNHPPRLIDVVKPHLIDHGGIPADIPAALHEKVTLRTEAIDIRSLMLGLAKQTNLNLALDPDVTGQVSAFFTDVEVITALEQIADQLGAEVEVHGNIISVHKPRNEIRMFRLHYLRSARAGVTAMGLIDRAGTATGIAGGGSSSQLGASSGQTAGGTAIGAAKDNEPTGTTAVAPRPPPNRGDSQEQIYSQFTSNFWEDLGDQLRAFIFDGDTPKEMTVVNNHSAGITVTDFSGRKLIIDSMAGNIVVQARRNVLDDIATYLKSVEETIQRQVIIDVRILEVQLQDQTIFGIDSLGAPVLPSSVLSSLSKSLGTGTTLSSASVTTPLGFQTISNSAGNSVATSATSSPLGNVLLTPASGGSAAALTPGYGLNIFGSMGGQNFQLMIQALGQLTDLRVVASPRLTALHNQMAMLKVVREQVYFLLQPGSSTIGTAGIPIVTASTYYPVIVPVGVIMDLTPLIDDNGEVTLEIHPSFSTIADVVNAPGGSVPGENGSEPEVDRREFDTTVHVRGEETIMLGGLVMDTSSRAESGIPLLKDIPFLGGLFRNTNSTTSKSEIILLLTPRVQGPTVARDFVNGLRTLSDQTPIPVVAPPPDVAAPKATVQPVDVTPAGTTSAP